MANNIFILIKRDFRRAMNLRTWLIWIALAGMGIFFFSATGGKTKLMNSDQIEFLALFLPHMIFGSWAVLSSYFDLFSSDREHNVLDCIMCSGINKSKIFLSKVLTTAIMSLVLSLIYMLPITGVIRVKWKLGTYSCTLAISTSFVGVHYGLRFYGNFNFHCCPFFQSRPYMELGNWLNSNAAFFRNDCGGVRENAWVECRNSK